MHFKMTDKILERESLLSFFNMTDQDSLEFLGEDVNIVFWSYDAKKKEMVVTVGNEQLYGYDYDELREPFLWESLHPENKDISDSMKQSIQKKQEFDLKYQIIRKDGTVAWMRTKGRPIFDSSEELVRYNGFTLDISDIKFSEIELTESAIQYQTLVENSIQGVYISQNGKYQYVNDRMMEMTGYNLKEMFEMSYDQILDEESKALVLKRVDSFLSGKDNDSQEIKLIRKDRSKITVELNSSLIMYRNKPALMGTLLDITEKKQAQEMIHHLAYYDTLTGLPNRNLFYKTINQTLKEAFKNNQKLALLFVDLDQFKIVNDMFGHHAGDILIKEVAIKMSELMPAGGFVARYGGDEFVALLTYEEVADFEDLVKRIIKEVPKSLSSEITVTPTIGISLFPEHGDDVESLLSFADIAMYHSKRNENREQNYSIYSHSISSSILKSNKLMNDLQKAVELNQFYLVYQPKVELGTSKLEGVEALIRWKHPEYGNISPMDFIPLAEKSGDINKIGDWVLEKAINDIQTVPTPLILNVNISTRQLLQDSFVTNVELLLQKTGFPIGNLNLEITESVALYDVDQTIEKLKQLNKLGIKVSLDDFGTGYSSLSYLTKLPIDYLKVDQSFVNGMENEESKRTIIKSIIEIAHNLNMKVIAEGIETKEQADLLVDYNCDMGQGYYFSKPLIYEGLLNYVK